MGAKNVPILYIFWMKFCVFLKFFSTFVMKTNHLMFNRKIFRV